jgi:cytochrome c peroxidase
VPVAESFELKAPVYFGEFRQRIPADNPVTQKGFELGKMLFYEKKLSGDNSMSCGTCHQQSKAFTDGQAVSLGIDGQPGKVSAMSLVNMLWMEKFTWDGTMNSLEDQSIEPIINPIEMHSSFEEAIGKLENDGYTALFNDVFGSPEIDEDRIAKALAQFQMSLISGNSKYDLYLRGEYQATGQEVRGMQLFFTHPIPGQLRGGNCGDCHLGPLTSGAIDGFSGFHNNGLDDDANLDNGLMKVTGKPEDKGRFKTPSLRNIALTAPYMHDGRFETLEEVLAHYNEGIKRSETLDLLIKEGSNEPVDPHAAIQLFLTDQEKEDIIAFLHLLTDEEFINDERFLNPFME